MASSGKKRTKITWKPAAQSEIIQISGARNYTNWAEEVENNEAEEFYDTKPVVLPTAPRSSCMVAVDESKVPLAPPFQAHVSNLPYELTEEELKALFPESNVKEVKIPKEDRGNRAKGYGYVVFGDRVSLIAALHMVEVFVKGRSIRIELATSGDSGRGGGRSRGSQRSDPSSMNSSSIDRTAGNWRSGPREEADDRDRGGPRRDRDYGAGGFSRRENESFHDRRERDERFRGEKERSFDRPRYDDWGSKDSNRSSSFRRDERPRDDPPPRSEPSSEPKNRPKLNLIPRSRDLPPPAATNEPTTSNSIFGNAKPVDTSAKLREIEERLAKNEILSEKSRSAGSSTGSSSSAARSAVDLKERKAEPAQLPKENAWSRSRSSQQAPRVSRPEEQKDI